MFSSELAAQLPSNRRFGLLFSLIFFLLGSYLTWLGRNPIYSFSSFFLALTFLILAVFFSISLYPLNRLWMLFGLFLGRLVSPIVLGAIFFILISPIAVAMRIFGRDELLLKPKNRSSFWRIRVAKDQDIESFKNQF